MGQVEKPKGDKVRPKRHKIKPGNSIRKIDTTIRVPLTVTWTLTDEDRIEKTERWVPDHYPQYELVVNNSCLRAQVQLIDLDTPFPAAGILGSLVTGQPITSILLWATKILNRTGRLGRETPALI
jgi:hypothetical protein